MSKLPSVVSSIPPDLKAFVNQVREALDGRGADKLVTVDDLVRGGVVVQGPNNTVTSPAGGSGGVVGTPATPKNVQASGAIQNIIVTWDNPLYNGHAYTEVWSSSTNDLGTAVQVGMTPGAIFVDSVGPSVTRYYWVRFVNALGVKGAFNAVTGVQGVTGSDVAYLLDTLTDAALDPASDYTKFAVRADFFYVMPSPDFSQEATPTATAVGDLWYQPSTELVRTWTGSTWGPFVQTLPFVVNSSPQTINGVAVPAGVYMDAAFIKDGTITNAKIGNATIDTAKIVSLTADKITAGEISVGNYIQSSGFISGSQGWRIHGNGAAEFAAASIRGKLTAGQVDTRGLSVFDDAGGIILSTNTQKSLNDVAVGSSKFLAVGENGTTSFSNDGVRWPSSAIGTTTLLGVCWSSTYSKFYVVGDNGSLLSTPDGLVWEYLESNTAQSLRTITQAGTTLFAVGTNGTIVKSVDATVWTVVASGTTADLQDIVWTGTQLVVVGAGGVVRTSPDGVIWTAQISGTVQTLNGIIFGESLFVAVGNAGTIITSPDAVTWTTRTSGTAQNLNEVTYGNSLFMAVGAGGTIRTSPLPATTWTSRSASTSGAFSAVTYGLSKFALVGATGLIRSSIDGTSFAAPGVNVFSGDASGTVAGTAASTLVNTANTASSTANSAVSAASAAQGTADNAASAASAAQGTANAATTALTTKLNSNARNVLAGAGGLATGTLNWNSVGSYLSGSGIGITQQGIAAINSSGAATFVLNGSNGDASFAGALSAATGSFAGSLSAATGTFSGTLTASAINAVNTINIGPNQVTVPAASTGSGASASVTITLDGTYPVAVIATFNGARIDEVTFSILRNGSAILATASNSSGGVIPFFPVTVSTVDYPPAGTHTYSLSTTRTATDSFIFVLGAKR